MITNEEMLDAFDQYAELGVIEYVLPTKPLGERWVLGIEGQILNMDQEQAICWLAGASAVARRLAKTGARP